VKTLRFAFIRSGLPSMGLLDALSDNGGTTDIDATEDHTVSKITWGVMAGLALAAVAAVPLANAGAGTPSPQATVNTAAVAAPAAAPITAAAATTTAPKTTTKPVVTVPVVLPVPAPTKVTPSPDPRSAACKANPTALYCGVNSVRYIVSGTTLAAHTKWLPVVTKWGVTGLTDTCADQTAQEAATTGFCVVRGTHGSAKVTLLFKAIFSGPYAPANVDLQIAKIHEKALADTAKATTVTAKAKIMQAAAARAAAIQKTADAYNAAHPATSVNVAVTQ
jgi:hypothetical protein